MQLGDSASTPFGEARRTPGCHGYVMQLVCQGCGVSPADAWDDARSRGAVPPDLLLPERVVAIREDAAHELLVA